jgi:integrase
MSQLRRVDIDAQYAVTVPVPLEEQAVAFAKRSKALRTHEAYAYQWKLFAGWCERSEHCALPCTPKTLVRYITALATGETSKDKVPWRPASIALALTAINKRHLREGYDAPRSHQAVREVFKGICNTLGTVPLERKTPVLAETLSRMVEVLPDTLRGTRDRALLLVGFTGAFRRSELVDLQVSDFTFRPGEGVVVRLRKSKTDQAQLGRNVALPYSRLSHRACPVFALRAWLEQSGIADGFVFRSVDRHQNIGDTKLCPREVARIVKRTAAASGTKKEDIASLAGHSLRAGLVTSAAKNDKKAATIMKQTGHTSVEMVTRYIRDAELFTDNAADGLL